MIDVIIPARNEARTIGSIVNTFVHCERIRSVIVIVDGDTTDHTAFVAGSAGAFVRVGQARGKGQCVKAGLEYVETAQTVLCDADLTGFTAEHIEELTAEKDCQTIGIPDFPLDDILTSGRVIANPDWFRRIMTSYPMVSGERCVPTRVLRSIDLHGYLTEAQINVACARMGIPTGYRILVGLRSPFIMSDRRVEEMLRDRAWGIENGVLPGFEHYTTGLDE